MKSKAIFKFGVIALSIVLVACSGGSSDEAGCPEIDGRELNVVATTPMIGEFVNQVGGDNINLTVIMPAEADPHTYEPAPQDAKTGELHHLFKKCIEDSYLFLIIVSYQLLFFPV